VVLAEARTRRGGPSARARREGSVGVSGVQRARILSSAVRVVSEYGYARMSVARVAGGARVSRRTFYDVFQDREDCFLAVFEDGLARVSARVGRAYASAGDGPRAWCGRVRAALTELLVFFDEEPGVASLLVVDALGAGPRVLERRAQVLKGLSGVLHEDGVRAGGVKRVAPLAGEGVVGAVFGVIHTRLSQEDPAPVLELLNPLVGIVVLPYLGQAAAQRELRGMRTFSSGREQPAGLKSPTRLPDRTMDPLAGLPMRVTYRTLRVLRAIAERPGASNRVVGELAETHDQGQISKLLARLEKLGLIENTSGENRHRPTGEPNAWRLTVRGREVELALRVGADDGGGSSGDGSGFGQGGRELENDNGKHERAHR
jgi:AcrR family transcriptional regulator